MSRAQFARVHPGLLARKGEAAPAIASHRATVTYLEPPAVPRVVQEAGAVEPDAGEQDQAQGEHFRLALRMTNEQRRKMWLVSARLGLSRQAILDLALDAFMAELAGGQLKDCRCFRQDDTPGSCDLGR